MRSLGDVVVEVLKDFGIATQRAADGIFRPPIAIAHGAYQFGLQPLVVQHRQMSIKDRSVLAAQFRMNRVAVAFDFAGCLGHRIGEPFQLGIDGTAFNKTARDSEPLAVENESLADCDAGGNGDALKF